MFRNLLLFFTILFFSGCVSLPNVYLVDRHTIMESEASGEWPEMERRFIDASLSAGPVALEKDSSEKETRAHILLNAELASGAQVKTD